MSKRQLMTSRLISKGDWYDDGTESFPLSVFDDFGPNALLMVGIKDGRLDEEICLEDEFIYLGHGSE